MTIYLNPDDDNITILNKDDTFTIYDGSAFMDDSEAIDWYVKNSRVMGEK